MIKGHIKTSAMAWAKFGMCLWLTLPCLPAVADDPGFQKKSSQSAEQDTRKVVMFSSTYCASCMQMKRYLKDSDIPFLEFDIEKSKAALDYFLRLGGRGTPFLLVNNRRMHGYDTERFQYLYQQQ